MADLLQDFDKDDYVKSSRSGQAGLNPFDDDEERIEAVSQRQHAIVQTRCSPLTTCYYLFSHEFREQFKTTQSFVERTQTFLLLSPTLQKSRT